MFYVYMLWTFYVGFTYPYLAMVHTDTLCIDSLHVSSKSRTEESSLLWKFMLYEFELGHNAKEATKKKKICGAKGEDVVDLSTQKKWLKKN